MLRRVFASCGYGMCLEPDRRLVSVIPNDDASLELISWGSKLAGVNGRPDPRF